jgi:hypothetical protein
LHEDRRMKLVEIVLSREEGCERIIVGVDLTKVHG